MCNILKSRKDIPKKSIHEQVTKASEASTKRPQIKSKITFEDVPHYAISGFFGGLGPTEGSISFFQDRLIPSSGPKPGQISLSLVEQRFLASIKMSPQTFKKMAFWMMGHVKRYESSFGEIKLPKMPGAGKDPSHTKKSELDTPAYTDGTYM